MNYGINLYTTFDADLISLNAAGISVPYMIRKALEYRVRGARAHFFVTGCVKYELASRKRRYHLTVKITDEASIRFLSTQIKPRQRSAFFRAIVREALVNQSVGVYLRTDEGVRKEDNSIKRQDIDGIDNVFIMKPKKKLRKNYVKEVLSGGRKHEPEDSAPEEEKTTAQGKFGDVEDLSLHAQKKKTRKTEGQEEGRGRKENAHKERNTPKAENNIPEEETLQEDEDLPVGEEDDDTDSETRSAALMQMFVDM